MYNTREFGIGIKDQKPPYDVIGLFCEWGVGWRLQNGEVLQCFEMAFDKKCTLLPLSRAVCIIPGMCVCI